MPKVQKVHEWLSELGSHGIYEYDEMIKDFEENTGLKAPASIPYHSVEGTKAAIAQRGLGGDVTLDPRSRVAWGWEVSSALAEHYAPGKSRAGLYAGRGRRFNADVDALKEANI